MTPQTLGLNPSREFQRSQRHKECETRGYHQRSGKVETKTMGGQPYSMELCGYCDVWVEPGRSDWRHVRA
jgi:hypothetical protein